MSDNQESKLREIIQDFLINEECSCLKLGQHPCSRCKVTIDEAKEVITDYADVSGPEQYRELQVTEQEDWNDALDNLQSTLERYVSGDYRDKSEMIRWLYANLAELRRLNTQPAGAPNVEELTRKATNAAYRIWNDLVPLLNFIGAGDTKDKAIGAMKIRFLEQFDDDGASAASPARDAERGRG